MKRRIISIVLITAFIVTMVIPAWGAGGDNTGNDNMPCTTGIPNSKLLGEYQIGTPKEFEVDIWASTSVGQPAVRSLEITGDYEVSDFEFKDSNDVWKPVSEYNAQIVIANMQTNVRVTFNHEGIYKITASLYTVSGKLIYSAVRNISVSNAAISLCKVEETTTLKDIPTEETTTLKDIPTEEITTPRGEDKTTLAVATTKSTDGITLGQAKAKKTKKKLSSAKVKISLKKIKGADKYQIQISKTKNFKKKLVKKTVKKVKTTIKSKKLRNRKKLYLRVRAVKIAAGNKYYGNWSKAKRIKIKK